MACGELPSATSDSYISTASCLFISTPMPFSMTNGVSEEGWGEGVVLFMSIASNAEADAVGLNGIECDGIEMDEGEEVLALWGRVRSDRWGTYRWRCCASE